MKDMMKVTVCNMKSVWGDKAANLAQYREIIEKAATENVNLVLFPEMSLTSYDDQYDVPVAEKMQVREAEVVPGPSSEFVAELTKKYHMYVVFGMPERDADEPSVIYNSACACGPDGIIGTYRKIHLPFPETNWATRGEEPLLLNTEFGKMGISICYDTYCFPELVRYYVAKGVRVHLNPTAYARCHGTFQSRIAIENHVACDQIYMLSSNLVGVDLDNDFWGGASVIGPRPAMEIEYVAGHPFCDPAGMVEGTWTTEIDLSKTGGMMFTANPANPGSNADYRPAIYKKLMEDLTKDEVYQE